VACIFVEIVVQEEYLYDKIKGKLVKVPNVMLCLL